MINSECNPGNGRVIEGFPSNTTWYSLDLFEDLEFAFHNDKLCLESVKTIQSQQEDLRSLPVREFIEKILLEYPGREAIEDVVRQEKIKEEIWVEYNKEKKKKKRRKKEKQPRETDKRNFKEMLENLSKKLSVRVTAMEEFGRVLVKLHLPEEMFPLSVFGDPKDKVMRDFIDGERGYQLVSGMSVRNVSDPINNGGVDLVKSFSKNQKPVEKLFELMKRVVCSLEGLSNHEDRELKVNLSVLSSTSATRPQPPHTDLDTTTISSSRVDSSNPRPWSFVFPILENGSQLNVWGSEKEGSKLYEYPTKVKCEPHTMLLWHHSLIHGGGLPGIKDTLKLNNVRFHGYVTVDQKNTNHRHHSICSVAGSHQIYHKFSDGSSLNSKLRFNENHPEKGDDRIIS
jgi:hypothetical protein